jgi:hypothetical protein
VERVLETLLRLLVLTIGLQPQCGESSANHFDTRQTDYELIG